jgi:hypothetical protein
LPSCGFRSPSGWRRCPASVLAPQQRRCDGRAEPDCRTGAESGRASDSTRCCEPDCRWRRGRLIHHPVSAHVPTSGKPASRTLPKQTSFSFPPLRNVHSRSSIAGIHGIIAAAQFGPRQRRTAPTRQCFNPPDDAGGTMSATGQPICGAWACRELRSAIAELYDLSVPFAPSICIQPTPHHRTWTIVGRTTNHRLPSTC